MKLCLVRLKLTKFYLNLILSQNRLKVNRENPQNTLIFQAFLLVLD